MSNRRGFLWTTAGFGSAWVASAKRRDLRQTENVHRFKTPECDGQVSFQFLDQYASKNLRFDEHFTSRGFCVSRAGSEGRECIKRFCGSIAIALYHFQPLPAREGVRSVRELVRTIDQDNRITTRAPFERVVAVQRHTVSDIQAFGYDPEGENAPATVPNPWCLLRQELYLDQRQTPFLIVHWKHTLTAITVIDVIPGDQTRMVE